MLARLTTLRSQDGFTLIELLVAMIAGVIVAFAALLIVTTSWHQEIQITDHVRSDQIGRTSLERIQDELHSSCIGDMSPIQGFTGLGTYKELEALNGANLWFVSTYATEHPYENPPKEGFIHDIHWAETGKSRSGERLGTLTDYRFKQKSGEPPSTKWTFESTLSPTTATGATVIAKNVTPLEAGTPGGTTVFHYFKYDTTATDEHYGTLVEMTPSELPPASETAAYKIAQVKINYQQAPEKGDTREGHTTTVSGAIVLRFTPSETTEEGTATCA
jgi:prepilin-type N-terminal cleavage/methylation domain-containing protein